MKEKECTEFIAAVPEVWDETVGLDGKVGEYIAIARRNGSDWYVGAMTDWSAREMTLDLSFLPEGSYQVELYKDGVNADRAACDYKKETIELPADKKLNVKMMPGGGFAAKLIYAEVRVDHVFLFVFLSKQYSAKFILIFLLTK